MNEPEKNRGKKLGARGVLLIFVVCAFGDFLWARFGHRSTAEAAACAILGLFGTAWYLLLWEGFDKLAEKANPQRRKGK